MERQHGSIRFPALRGETSLSRLLSAAEGGTLPYSAEVKVNQDDLRNLLGAYFLGAGPWQLDPFQVQLCASWAQDLMEQVPPAVRQGVEDALRLPSIGRPR